MASVTPLDKMVAVTLYWKFALIYCTVYRACRTLHYTRVPGCTIEGLVAVLGVFLTLFSINLTDLSPDKLAKMVREISDSAQITLWGVSKLNFTKIQN